MLKLIYVGLGGFVGALSRYGLSGLVHRYYSGSLPAGTFVVNVLGCLVIGALMGLVEDRQLLSPEARVFLTIGVVGSFTTFSTAAFETYEMLRARELAWAALNVSGQVVLGLVAVWIGRAAVRWVLG